MVNHSFLLCQRRRQKGGVCVAGKLLAKPRCHTAFPPKPSPEIRKRRARIPSSLATHELLPRSLQCCIRPRLCEPIAVHGCRERNRLTSAFPSTHLTDFTHDPLFAGAPFLLSAITLQPASTSCSAAARTREKWGMTQRRWKRKIRAGRNQLSAPRSVGGTASCGIVSNAREFLTESRGLRRLGTEKRHARRSLLAWWATNESTDRGPFDSAAAAIAAHSDSTSDQPLKHTAG